MKTFEVAATISRMTWNGQRIRTSHDYPPIPIRTFDWSAWIDGHEENGPYGQGPTRDIATADLIEQLYERNL